ncbi:hypothetical protein BCR44DRAFT_1011844 [Catenaria anguillulae PL171]|uniref:SH3 domain-containing protein n=1 Tax=Catenaria anguillulae PL171 TaxID=765915 RepID=A0A1Y2I497_9FUNG|nr:hypothetical protein BCR44DRAFT_1011844 [Catenaria anguillulae PL171]
MGFLRRFLLAYHTLCNCTCRHVCPVISHACAQSPSSLPAPSQDRGHHLLARGRGRGRGRGAPTSTRRASRFLERIASSGTIITPASLTSTSSSGTLRTSPTSPLARHATSLAPPAPAPAAGPDMSPALTTLVPGGTYVAIAAYLARKRDEVSVMRGDQVLVERVLSDGWCVGVNRDLEGVRGVFPLYVVEEVEE